MMKTIIDKWRVRENNAEIYEVCRLNYFELYNAAHIIQFPLGNIYMCCVKLSSESNGICDAFPSLFEAVLWCDKILIKNNFNIETPLIYPFNKKYIN